LASDCRITKKLVRAKENKNHLTKLLAKDGWSKARLSDWADFESLLIDLILAEDTSKMIGCYTRPHPSAGYHSSLAIAFR
jgi:hypothetical protein